MHRFVNACRISTVQLQNRENSNNRRIFCKKI